ncbi:MAG: T9SS type A sorting domain-containing protein [Bacteroidales bacterium]|nr:T9SS type A sorting domain-containing protein [Bacteroidales bacterium]MCF8454761.1 T9SS type A sorting domain-containing protein [Bacteroidales bacterium]
MKSKISTLIFTFLLFVSTVSWGQFLGEGSNWYFGGYAGCTWVTLQANGDPMYMMDGQLTTNEGVATISDGNGVLLFYTDGIKVWNALHNVMPNSLPTSPGGSLTGNPSSTQSGVIVPKPLDPNTYYIFSVDANLGSGGLAYSRIDMLAAAGMGDVALAEKNVTLFNPSTEKITAVSHSNALDIWVITHQWQNNQFNVYKVTSMGVQLTTPVISNIGVVHTGTSGNCRGYMKASASGTMVCLGIEGMNIWELFQFNNSTGQLSNVVTLDYTMNDDCYGVEFSADEHFLYGSERWGNDLHQWDVSSYIPATIQASHQIVATLGTSAGGSLQLAPDQKIYLARDGTKYLGRINEPTLAGSLCAYVDHAVLLGPDLSTAKDSNEGLPTFIATFFQPAQFTFTTDCENDTVFFFIPNPAGLDNAYWNFDWPTTNPAFHYTSNADTIYFIYPAGGVYTVELITQRDNLYDTVYADVYFSQLPEVNLGPDVTLCDNEILTFDLSYNDVFAVDGVADYFWEAALATQTFYDSTATYLIDKPGTYTATVYVDSICGSVSDILNVEYNNMVASLGVDITTGLCAGGMQVLDATYSNTTYGPSQYNWSTGSNQPSITVYSTGIYSVTIVNGLCTDTDSIYVQFDSPLVVPLGADKNICDGSLMTLDAHNPGANYAWSTGMLTQTIEVDLPGTYSVTITNDCGVLIDTIILSPLDIPNVDLGPDITICEGSPGILDATVPNCTYVWSSGQMLNQIAVYAGGSYFVTVTNECGDNFDDIYVYADQELLNLNIGNDTAVCSGFVLDCGYPNMEYYWSNNESTQQIVITQSDDYGVDITNACGTYSDFIHIDVIEMDVDLGGDKVYCPGSSLSLDALNPGSVYLWSNGAYTQTTEISAPGVVWVQVSNICETQTDSIYVSEYDMNLDLGNDTAFCDNGSIILDAEHPGATYSWSTGASTQTIQALQTGLYTLTVYHFCGDLTDDIDIVVNPSPVVHFSDDTLIILGGVPVLLDPNATGVSYEWSNGTTDSTYTASVPGTYMVTVTNEFGCTGTDKVVVIYRVGVDEVSIADQVLLYPNPVQNKLYIAMDNLRIEEIRIYSSIGSLISQFSNIDGTVEVDTQHLSEGIYFVKILTIDNELVIKSFSVVR